MMNTAAKPKRSARGLVQPIRKLLLDAPSTVRELAVILRKPVRDVALGVWCLTHSGHAETIGSVPSGDPFGRKTLNIYGLTTFGRYNARKKQEGSQ